MTITLEYFGEVNFHLGLVLQVIFAVIAGGIIGLEREVRMKSAGLRTNILICIGATLYTSVSILNRIAHESDISDPNRMAAQVVSGIGFLGAGAIIQSRGQVLGMTTAATIWLVAAVGVAIGSGFPLSALAFVIVTVAVLRLIDPLYALIRLRENFHIDVLSYGTVKRRVDSLLNPAREEIYDAQEKLIDRDLNLYQLHLRLRTDTKRLAKLIQEIRSAPSVKTVVHQVARSQSNLLDDIETDHDLERGDDESET